MLKCRNMPRTLTKNYLVILKGMCAMLDFPVHVVTFAVYSAAAFVIITNEIFVYLIITVHNIIQNIAVLNVRELNQW